MTNAFACSFSHPRISWAPTACRTPCLKVSSSYVLSASSSLNTAHQFPLAYPLANNFYDFYSCCTCRTLLHCPCLQLSVKHPLHFIIALCNAIWSTNCFKCARLIFQANLQGICNVTVNILNDLLNSSTKPGTRLGTQNTLHFLSSDYPGVLG